MDGNFCEIEKRIFELFRIWLCLKKITEKSLEIFGTFWNQLGNFIIILKPVISVKTGIESNCTIVNFWNLGRIQWNIALEDK